MELKQALNQGGSFLAREQAKDGNFVCYASSHRREFEGGASYESVFPAALLLDCLQAVGGVGAVAEVRKRLADFLLTQKSEHWTFNYWARGSKGAEARPYPDDLDDTCCALAGLTQYDRSLVDAEALAKAVTVLTAVEQEEGGPYYTWLAPPDAEAVWRDVDLAVNSNVAYFLSLHEVTLPNLTALTEQAIKNKEFVSPYYPSAYPIVYFMARWYRGELQKELRDWLLEQRYAAGTWGAPLTTALAVSALLRLGAAPGELKPALKYLLEQQGDDGSWPAASLWIDRVAAGGTYYMGSAALTTGFCLEAIGLYGRTQRQQQRERKSTEVVTAQYEAIVTRAEQRMAVLEGVLGEQAHTMLEKMVKGDTDKQIVLLPQYTRVALGAHGQAISDELVEQLGVASLYGWMAYTIYDDFLDEEGELALLPVANVCLRELAQLFTTVVEAPAWQTFFDQVMDRLEAANAWEVTHCRGAVTNEDALIQLLTVPDQLPDYGDLSRLADRSLGHALGSVALLFSLGYGADSLEVRQLTAFFEDYLVARQLNDDMHDWEDDLRRGQINAVGTVLLAKWREMGEPLKSLETGLERLRELFWHEVVVTMCEEVERRLGQARQALATHPLIENGAPLERLLKPVEKSAREALTEREETLAFLAAYGEATSVSS